MKLTPLPPGETRPEAAAKLEKRSSSSGSEAGESEGGAGAGGRDTTTTCTSEEDVTHYHAYTQVDTLDICRYQ